MTLKRYRELHLVWTTCVPNLNFHVILLLFISEIPYTFYLVTLTYIVPDTCWV